MSEPTSGQSGGINNPGTLNTGGGDVIGGNKTTTTTTTYYSPTDIRNAWQPVADAIRTAPPENQAEAAARLDDLKKESAKGDKAEDTAIAKLVKGLASGIGTVRGQCRGERLRHADLERCGRTGDQICSGRVGRR